MKPIKKGQLDNQIQSAYVQYLDNGEKILLNTKSESRCHFFDPIYIGEDKVVLRIDWGDLDSNGHPKLDADFYGVKSGKKRKLRGKWQDAHHTEVGDSNGRVYEWSFEEYHRAFRVVVHWVASMNEKLVLGDTVSAELIKKGSNGNQ